MKVAPIIRVLLARQEKGGLLRYRLVHTGQHYDTRMSGTFFDQLGIPEPDVNLEVGSGSQAEQAGSIMVRYEKLLLENPSHLCVVVGDVTSTMACAISAQKLGIPVAHVEAGIRSGDWSMPEEVNRMVTDAITNWFFTTSEFANRNLAKAGIPAHQIFFVGNTMIDTLLANMDSFRPPPFWDEMELQAGKYLVLTLHRPGNVDQDTHLEELLRAVSSGVRDLPVVFPVHPRTAKTIESLVEIPPNIHPVNPQPYLEFNYLVSNARAIITDSGGITEETTVLGIPCLTLRDSTERPETISTGTNELIGIDPANLLPALGKLFDGKWKKGAIPEKWDGRTAERIVAELETLLS